MIVKTQQDPSLSNIQVLIRYAQETGEVKKLLTLLHSMDIQILCQDEYRERLVNVSDIYYIESVDKKTFVYLEHQVLRCNRRLYQLMEELQAVGFVQISKSCLLNMQVLESIQPLFNSRLEAYLSNGERVVVTRGYLKEIRRALQEEEV